VQQHSQLGVLLAQGVGLADQACARSQHLTVGGNGLVSIVCNTIVSQLYTGEKAYNKMLNTVKSFNFVGMIFRGLTTLNMFADTLIRVFKFICNITKVSKYFVVILNLSDCPTYEIHKIKCPTNINDFTVFKTTQPKENHEPTCISRAPPAGRPRVAPSYGGSPAGTSPSTLSLRCHHGRPGTQS